MKFNEDYNRLKIELVIFLSLSLFFLFLKQQYIKKCIVINEDRFYRDCITKNLQNLYLCNSNLEIN